MKKDRIQLDTWEAVSDYIDNGFYTPAPSWFEHVIQSGSYYPRHAFSKGQLASKSWLLEALAGKVEPNATVAILGCWIGSLVEPLVHVIDPERVYGFDQDADAISKSEKLNQKYVQQGWRYKGVVADVTQLDCADMQFETGGELISVKPDCIINTSCEHMNSDWFDSVAEDQLIVMQTNNDPSYEGHINTTDSIEEMGSKYPLSNTLYSGEMITPAYTRLMQIGYK